MNYTIDDGAILGIDGVAFRCLPAGADASSVTLAEIINHLNTQCPRGYVERFHVEHGGIAWTRRSIAADGRIEIVAGG